MDNNAAMVLMLADRQRDIEALREAVAVCEEEIQRLQGLLAEQQNDPRTSPVMT